MSASAIAIRSSIVESAASANSLRAQIQLIQQAMRDVMIENVHYGKIPGTPKPTLFKPGAEVLCAMFHIAPLFNTEDLSTTDAVRYRVRCTGRHQATGVDLGEGVGECSSDEAKYRWRSPVCDEEFEAMPVDRRREKWSRGDRGPYSQKQIRTEPADLANTVLKMAAKRSHIAMALNVLAASDIFAQDLEDPDLPEGARGGQRTGARQQARRPQPARRPTNAADGSTNTGGAAPSGGASRVINDGQHRLLRAKLNEAGMDADALCKRFDVESITQLPMDRMNDALAFIADPERDAIRAAAGEGDGGQPPQQ